MPQPATLPSFLRAAPAVTAARPRLLDLPAAPPAAAMAADVYRPAAAPAYGGYPGAPAYPAHPAYAPPPALKPVYAPDGQLLGYVAAPPAPVAPASPPAAPASPNQRTGQAALTTVTAGLGVAGIFAPPVLPFAGAIGLVQALDTQIGNPISKGVGAVVNGVVDAGQAIGEFFGNLF